MAEDEDVILTGEVGSDDTLLELGLDTDGDELTGDDTDEPVVLTGDDGKVKGFNCLVDVLAGDTCPLLVDCDKEPLTMTWSSTPGVLVRVLCTVFPNGNPFVVCC